MYNISEIKVSAVNEVKKLKPSLNRHQILKTLSKALGYKSLGYLRRSFKIDKDGNLLERINPECSNETLDIAHYGFLFRVYTLMTEFKISYEESLELKRKIDRYSHFLLGYNGNINYSDIILVKLGLRKLIKGENTRLMAGWPFSLYCQRDRNFLFTNAHTSVYASYIWFDGFNPVEKSYFKGKNNFHNYIVKLASMFLKYDNVLFRRSLVEFLRTSETEVLEVLLKKFKHQYVSVSVWKDKTGAIIFNSTRTDAEPIEYPSIGRFV